MALRGFCIWTFHIYIIYLQKKPMVL